MENALALTEINGFRVLRVGRPGPDRRLRDGWVIEASVLARLLRIRLLRLEARVALVPAALAEAVEYRPAGPPRATGDGGDLGDATELLARAARTLDDSDPIG